MMIITGVVNLCLVVILLSLTSTAIGREMPTKNNSEKKIIQTGYVTNDDFDCVGIYKQPAFSHPLLKNHKIQMYPSFSKNSERNKFVSFNRTHIGLHAEGCPPGMVPIQRNKANISNQFSDEYPHEHFAILQYGGYFTTARGARAQINTYNPQVVAPQISAAYIWIQSERISSNLNSLEVGWAVHPSLYGDGVTRLTARWTTDNYQKTSCYNYQCPGFVQVHNHYHLGQNVGGTSTSGGDQYEIDLMIKQDQSTGNWWLILDENEQVGYWPKALFPLLEDGAHFLQYGGWVLASPDGNSPPMGSGQLPNTEYKRSCYFRHVVYIDQSYLEAELSYWLTGTFADEPSCYEIQDFQKQGGFNGQTFSFGGPGGQCGT